MLGRLSDIGMLTPRGAFWVAAVSTRRGGRLCLPRSSRRIRNSGCVGLARGQYATPRPVASGHRLLHETIEGAVR